MDIGPGISSADAERAFSAGPADVESDVDLSGGVLPSWGSRSVLFAVDDEAGVIYCQGNFRINSINDQVAQTVIWMGGSEICNVHLDRGHSPF